MSGKNLQASLIKKIAAQLERRYRKSSMGRMYEELDPLFGIDSKKAQALFDYARKGNYAQLQYVYNEMEGSDAVFSTCVTRRCSAISELGWKVVRSDERLNRNADKNLIKEQKEYLETCIARIDNLPDALEHMALSAFRGFSVLNIHHTLDDVPCHLECLDHWNICFDKVRQVWKWNPDAISFLDPTQENKKLITLPYDDIIAITRKRPIDWPAMKIFLRASLGERDYGRYIETYGLPPVIITMPQLANKEEEDSYLKAAEAVFVGRSGVVPSGSEVNFASEARGTDPFSSFLEHQMKQFVLLATGGTLTSLAESGSGTLAGNAQMEVWKGIVRSDIRLISNATNKQLCEKLIENHKDFKKYPVLVNFELDTAPKMTPDEVMEFAGKVASAGFEMDPEELSKATGFKIFKKSEENAPMSFNSRQQYVLSSHPKKRVYNASKRTITRNEIQKADLNDLSESLQSDFKLVADKINALLNLPEDERQEEAKKLIGELDSLIPDDPAMAEVIEEQMLKIFDQQIEEKQ